MTTARNGDQKQGKGLCFGTAKKGDLAHRSSLWRLGLLLTVFLSTLAFSASPGHSASVTLAWDTTAKATGYKLYRSLDKGVTWTLIQDVGNVLTYTLSNEADTGLILYRASAYNAIGESISTWQGAWYCGDWKPLLTPTGVGIK